jgi:hypothetical protein
MNTEKYTTELLYVASDHMFCDVHVSIYISSEQMNARYYSWPHYNMVGAEWSKPFFFISADNILWCQINFRPKLIL